MAELESAVESVEVDTEGTQEVESTAENAELARLRAEFARQKAALDKATKEAGDYKKQLRAKQTAEEVAAEEKRLADEERDRKLAEYEKRFVVAETSKKILSFVGDEEAATSIAESLYGAENIESALTAISKAWTAKEKSLRLEYGKIPSPSVGSTEGATISKAQLDAMSYMERLKFANEHPEEYERLMGR